MLKQLPDALNAEVVSGTVTNLEEAVEWLSYTFLFQRMVANPMAYGVTHAERETDPGLRRRRAQMIVNAARDLDRSRMARFAFGPGVSSRLMGYSEGGRLPDPSAPFGVTDLGRVASHFYIGQYGFGAIFIHLISNAT
jgi:activating signal cointegrator complex subunit 3